MNIPSTSRDTSSRLSHNAAVRNDNRRTGLENLNRLSRILVQSPLPSDNEIKEHFQICLKLFADNFKKISAKNVWNLKLIDYMRMVLISKSQEENSSLQVAGTSLDVGAKIYGIRVDDVHSDGFKLASNMARVNHEPEIEENQFHNDTVNQENRAPKRKRPEMIAKKPETLLEDIPKVPSRFFQTRTDAEVNLTSNLLTNTLPMHPFGHKLMLLSKAKAWPSYKTSKPYPIEKRYSFDIPNFNSFVISPSFAEFEIDQWDVDREDEQLNDACGAGILEVENTPVYELDGTIRDNFEHGEEDRNQKDEEERLDYIVHFPVNSVSRLVNDRSFLSEVKLCNNKVMSRVWAGPSHWKLKYLQPKRSKFTGKQRAHISKKERQTGEIINFLLDYPKIDKTKLYQPKTTIQNFDPIKCTLPLKIHLENKSRPLMLKPLYICNNDWVESNAIALNHDDDGNNNITMESIENGHQEMELSIHEEVNVCHQRQEIQMDCLVDIPETVQHLYVPFATSYKKINMKTLKQSMWKILLGESKEEQNIAEVVQKQSFSEVYQKLPQRLSPKMQKNLSCPLAFVALLHLGNEHNLLFTQSGESDFNIEQQNQFIP